MNGIGGRRQRRVWLPAGVVCVLVAVSAAVYVVRQMSRGGLQVSDTAGLLAVVLAVAAGLVAVVALRRQSQANTAAFADAALVRGWAATLARQVRDGESGVWRQLLGNDTTRINLVYTLRPAVSRAAQAPAAGQLLGGGACGVMLPDVVTYYRSTRPLRLVVTGAGGAGKTVLALELLLAILDGRAEDDPVPVRIPLSRWDTEQQTLPQLLVERLVEAYDWPRHMAAALVGHGLVLPVLDGLDEMDPAGPDGLPDPAAPRAIAVVEALNAYQQGRQAGALVLTCRTGHYDALVPRTVVDAARVAVQPVSADDARDYLTARAWDAARWQPLIDHLADHPHGLLAAVLSTPWRLCLAATVYHRAGDPSELLALPDADAVDAHLLARYIPAAVSTVPGPDGYTAEEVHRWLHRLTRRLGPAGTTGGREAPGDAGAHGPEGTDLLLHELWPLAGPTRVRATEVALIAPAALAVLVLGLSARVLPGWLVVVLSALPAAALTVPAVTPQRWTNPRRAAWTGRRRAATGWLVVGVAAGLTAGIMAGVAVVIAVGLMAGITEEPGTGRRTRAAIRTDARLGLMAGITAGLMAVLLAGIAFGLAVGLLIGLVTGAASRRYLVFLLCLRGRLPFRLGKFLDWAADAGLLRYSGAAYQYRHRELQHWLRQHPEPPAHP
ncbi:NACHT domain-containing protein [Streptomyces uncialis]|uniref:NACHT domain-containing protein n=1 Tax=Streptomyces uncialis TaxID=1048205 RepID=UPI0037962441